MEHTSFSIDNIASFKKKALLWASKFSTCAIYDSNSYSQDKYATYEWLLGADALRFVPVQKNTFESINSFQKEHNCWLMGYISYDVNSENKVSDAPPPDTVQFESAIFFEPRYVMYITKDNRLHILRNYPEAIALYDLILSLPENTSEKATPISLQSRMQKDDYIAKVKQVQDAIRNGYTYELNLCRELFAENITIHAESLFLSLNDIARAPFSAFIRNEDQYILCTSPERFIAKHNNKLISQPIKGTIRRGSSTEEDALLKAQLYHDTKERAENIMICDLVRNDLTPFAITGSIKVNELFGIYSFTAVHHMISTVECTLEQPDLYMQAIENAFPPGSMTGAPKIKTMQLIDAYECTKRGVFSGTIGYITPEKNADFNVIIRTLLYNKKNKYLSVQSGGAITIDSVPEQEWNELNLKSSVIEKILNHTYETN